MIAETTIDKKQLIEKVAFEYFLTKGYEATTVRMICKKAEVEPPTLYYYFGSKKGLFFSIVDKMLNDFKRAKEEKIIEKKPDTESMLRLVYEYSINYSIKYFNEVKFYLRYKLFAPDELKKDIEEYMRDTYKKKKKLYKDCLLEFYEAGGFKSNLEKAFYKFERLIDDSIFNVVFSNWRPTKDEIDETWNSFCNLQLKGLRFSEE